MRAIESGEDSGVGKEGRQAKFKWPGIPRAPLTKRSHAHVRATPHVRAVVHVRRSAGPHIRLSLSLSLARPPYLSVSLRLESEYRAFSSFRSYSVRENNFNKAETFRFL